MRDAPALGPDEHKLAHGERLHSRGIFAGLVTMARRLNLIEKSVGGNLGAGERRINVVARGPASARPLGDNNSGQSPPDSTCSMQFGQFLFGSRKSL